jgi:hypothetical protein
MTTKANDHGVKTPWCQGDFPGLLQDMEANSGRRDDLTQSDSVLIPESTLQAFLGADSTDLSLEATLLANENGWIAKRTADHHWLFKRKGDSPNE